MTPFAIDSAGIHIFAFMLHWYGLIIVAGGWIAVEVATGLAAREELEPEHIWRGLVWVVVCGLFGARLWFVLFPPDSQVALGRTADWYVTHLFDVNQGFVALWTGGLGLIGGLIGGALGLLIYTWRRGLPLLPWLDITAVVLPLAQAIGRWGSAASQDNYGPVTTLPWGVLIDNAEQRVGPYTDLVKYPLDSTRFHPLYAYESLFMFFVFAALLVAFLRYQSRFLSGDFALMYLVAYGVGRVLVESARVNVSHFGAVNVSQVAAGVLALGAFLVLVRRNRTNVLRPPGGVSQNLHSSVGESTLKS